MALFPTTVVGSLPRPEWLRELILDRKDGRISEEEAAPHLDRAAAMAISLQERTGLDEVTDGEWRRESYVKVFAERVRGFRNDLNLSNIPYPAVVEPIEYYRPIAAEEVAFARPRTTRRLKITLPAPYIIGRRMWHPDHSRDAYPRREDLMEAVVPILRQEIEAVRAAGADVVQLDEPWLSVMVDPEFRAAEGIGDPEPEMERCIDLLNRTLDGVSGIDTAMHLCHAHFQHRHSTAGAYDPIMPALAAPGSAPSSWSTPRRTPAASIRWPPFPRTLAWDSAASTTAMRPSNPPKRSWPAWRQRCATWTRSVSCSTPTAASRLRCRTLSPWTRRT